MYNVRRYNILLVGRTGNGKSSTRNSIIDRKVPELRDSSNRVVFTMESVTLQPGVEVSVIEGPGIGDTGADMAGSIESQLKLVEAGLNLCGFRVDAIVVVLKYGVRFTKQEKDAIQMIQSIFGGNCLQKCGVVLMTHGDNFEMDTEDEDDMTFEKWCKEQSGDIQKLFEDCAWRLLLFNNRTTEKSKQMDQLLKIIDSIESPYDEDDYKAAEPGRQILVLIAQREEIDRETDNFLKHVNDSLDQLDASPQLDVRDVEREETSVKSYLNELNVKDNGTCVLNSVMDKARLTLFRIQTLKRKAALPPLIRIAQREEIDRETDNFLKHVNSNLDKLDESPQMDVRDVEREESSVKSYLNELIVKDNDTSVLNSVMDKARLTFSRIQTLKRKAALPPLCGEIPPNPVAKKDKPPYGFFQVFARWFNLKTGVLCFAGLGIGLLIWRKYGARKRLL